MEQGAGIELEVGGRYLVKFFDEKRVTEKKILEMGGEWFRWDIYPYWYKKNEFEIIQKLPPEKEKPPKRLWRSTVGLDCPLLKQKCSNQCAWFVKTDEYCIVLQLADDVNTIAEDE